MLFLCFQLSHKAGNGDLVGWGKGTGERHIPVEWHVRSQNDATSLQADVGDKRKSQVTIVYDSQYLVCEYFIHGDSSKWKSNFYTSKNHSVIASFNHFIRIYEICTSQCAKCNEECNDRNKETDNNNTNDPCSWRFYKALRRQMCKQLTISASRNKKSPSFILCLVKWLTQLRNLKDSLKVQNLNWSLNNEKDFYSLRHAGGCSKLKELMVQG